MDTTSSIDYSNIAKEIMDGKYCPYEEGSTEYKEWFHKRYDPERVSIKSPGIYKRFRREVSADTESGYALRDYLYDLYWKQEYGYKWIYRYEIDTTYTMLRTLFDLLGIEGRQGRSVYTKNLSKIRSDKAKKEWELGVGYGDPETRSFTSKTERGVQGYYYNEPLRKWVWIRSTYEYVYARWLNKTGQRWDVENKVYYLSDNTRYRPDFFIYDQTGTLELIVEIKGYWTNRSYKVGLLREVVNVPVSLISTKEIPYYMVQPYAKELKEWKRIRLLQNELESNR